MKTTMITASALLLASLSASASAQTAQAETAGAPAPAAHYSVSDTLVGKILDDPAGAAVLKRMIPDVYANDQFQQAGRALTLRGIQQYEPAALSDENLAKIQAELNKIPAKP